MPPRVAQCGTYGGWNRHIKRGEDPCEPCREAQRAYAHDWITRNPTRREVYQARRKAAYRALIALRGRHPGEYHKLFEQELRKG